MVGRYLKTMPFYVELHGFLMFSAVALTIAMEVIVLIYNWGSLWNKGQLIMNIHFVGGLVFFGLLVLQLSSGVSVRLSLSG